MTSEALNHKGNGVAKSRCHFAQASLCCPTTSLLDGHSERTPDTHTLLPPLLSQGVLCVRRASAAGAYVAASAFPARRPPTMGAPGFGRGASSFHGAQTLGLPEPVHTWPGRARRLSRPPAASSGADRRSKAIPIDARVCVRPSMGCGR